MDTIAIYPEIDRGERPIDEIAADVQNMDPRLINAFRASNAADQRERFMRGDVRNPQYDYQAFYDFDRDAIYGRLDALRAEFERHSELDDVYREAYTGLIDRYRVLYEQLEQAAILHNPDLIQQERDEAEAEYMRLNEVAWGGPDRIKYEGYLAQLRDELATKDLPADALAIRDELGNLLPQSEGGAVEVWRPRPETVEYMHELVLDLYGPMLRHIPERADDQKFTPAEAAGIFREIIAQEFGEAAEGWDVQVGQAYATNVNPTKKVITIPEKRDSLNHMQMCRLTVHELGDHFLRAVMGQQTDLSPMTLGLPAYNDFEEGVGLVVEESLEGVISRDVSDLYLAIGMATDGMDFRDVYEVMWRKKLLYADDVAMSDEAMEDARDKAYKTCVRVFRGADTLPWFKDLGYARGKEAAWRYFEDCFGEDADGRVEVDDQAIMLAFIGRINSTDPVHRRIALETKTP